MPRLHDIGTAVAELLKSAGYSVTAASVDEGFARPTFFIDVFQNSVTRINPFMEQVSVSVELAYHPDEPASEVQVKMADSLTVLLTREPLRVKDRRLTVEEIQFDTDNAALNCSFDLNFSREPATDQREYEPMEGLEFRTGIRQGGKFEI